MPLPRLSVQSPPRGTLTSVIHFIFFQINLAIVNLALSTKEDYGCQFTTLGSANGFRAALLENIVVGSPNMGTCLFHPISADVIPIDRRKNFK